MLREHLLDERVEVFQNNTASMLSASIPAVME